MWCAMREHAWIITTAFGGKAANPQELRQFPWEIDREAEKKKEEEDAIMLAEMMKEAREHNRKVTQK